MPVRRYLPVCTPIIVWIGRLYTLKSWCRYEPSVPVPVETLLPVAVRALCAGTGRNPLCRWRYEPSVPVAVRALCAGGGMNPLCRWRYEPSVPVAV